MENTLVKSIRLALVGATGKLAKAIIAECSSDDNIEVSHAITHSRSSLLNERVSSTIPQFVKSETCFSADIENAISDSDIIVECSGAGAFDQYLPYYERASLPIIFTSTGFTPTQYSQIEKLSKSMPILVAPNLSAGVNISFKLVEMASRVAMDPVDVSIIEYHHREKKDAPSGTALMFEKLIRKHKPQASISICSVRGGTVIGDHLVTFMFRGERIEINHKAETRANAGRGCVVAINWLTQQQAGMYDMYDALDLI